MGSIPITCFENEYFIYYARVAQLVEHDLAKVGVAGSSPVSRSAPVGAGLCFFSFIRDEGVAGAFFQRNKSTYWPLAWLVLNSETHV